ncbi:MAG TPA: T9SS type A sorting domain-containing protein, partial [Bacteroidia bacterium]|nr:T9SS type A sorting domain-containing protein [Bacteroidia bacterium]
MIKYIYTRVLFCMLALFMVVSFSTHSQTNWYATPCNGSNYWNFGNITPTGSSQTVGGLNFNSGGPSLLGRGSFSVTAAAQHFCFSLNLTGSGYPYGADGTNGCEILILDGACGTASQNIIADFYSGYTNGPGNQITQCGCWTSAAADVGKTYYIELSEGAGGGTYFGADGFCTVYFSYMTGDYTCNASNVIVLPIELTSFTAKQLNTKTKLEWATASESNNNYFTIERSLDGTNFISISEIKGANNSTTTLDYSVFDEEPAVGINYYRLKQTDYNGKFKYSKVISVNYLSKGASFSNLHPNPANENINFDLYSPVNTKGNLQVMDITGRVISEESQNISAGNQTIGTTLNALSNGIYYLKISIDEIGYSHISKII